LKNNKLMYMFRNRLEAGLLLADKLEKYKDDPGIILAVPRGGIPVAYAVAKEFSFPLEVVLTKKIGHPQNKECAIGAASVDDYFVAPQYDVSPGYINREVEKIRSRLKEMYQLFMGGKQPVKLEGKTVIVIDDGIATGNTLISTIGVIRKARPGKIVIAVPVAPKTAVEKILKEADDVVAIIIPKTFYGVGAFYEDFSEVTDEEVLFYLKQLSESKRAA